MSVVEIIIFHQDSTVDLMRIPYILTYCSLKEVLIIVELPINKNNHQP